MTATSRRRNILIVLGTVFAFAAGVALYVRFIPYSISWNLTRSIPVGLYWAKVHDGHAPRLGDIVCFRYREPQWATGRAYFPPGHRLCKPVAGVPGDTVHKGQDSIQILTKGTTTLKVVVADSDLKGRPLSTEALQDGAVAQGTVVLLAPRYPNSFDSRYVGPVFTTELTHEVWPLWVKE